MQAVVLAAGFGKRLQPITNELPKCLVPINGKPMLLNTLELLENRGVKEVVIVVGHLWEKVYEAVGPSLREIKISYIENPLYDKTNNVYSLWLARDRLNEDTILLECDLYYGGDLLDTLIENRRDCNVLVSKYDPSCMDGTVLEIDKHNVIKRLVVKRDQDERFDFSDKYKTVNIYYFGREFLQKYLVPYLDLYVRTQGVNNYYELVLGALVYLGEPKMHAVMVGGERWCEVDDENDLRRAEERFTFPKDDSA